MWSRYIHHINDPSQFNQWAELESAPRLLPVPNSLHFSVASALCMLPEATPQALALRLASAWGRGESMDVMMPESVDAIAESLGSIVRS